ncbi:hypothetical protein ACP4OV_000179 [Aristida adscensionis]
MYGENLALWMMMNEELSRFPGVSLSAMLQITYNMSKVAPPYTEKVLPKLLAVVSS